MLCPKVEHVDIPAVPTGTSHLTYQAVHELSGKTVNPLPYINYKHVQDKPKKYVHAC